MHLDICQTTPVPSPARRLTPEFQMVAGVPALRAALWRVQPGLSSGVGAADSAEVTVCRFMLDRSGVPLEPGKIGLPGPRRPGAECSLQIVPAGAKRRSALRTETGDWLLVVHLPNELIRRAAGEIGTPEREARIQDHCGPADVTLTSIARAIERELRLDVPGGPLLLEASALQLAVHLLRHFAEGQVPTRTVQEHFVGGLAPWQERRVLEHMRDNLESEIRVADLAGLVRLSEGYFGRAFRRTVGMSPHAYLRTLRIERAQTLLQANDLPLAEVALAVGYASQSSFGLAFRRTTGLSPKAWQRRFR